MKIYYTMMTQAELPDLENDLCCLAITPANYWEEKHCQSDQTSTKAMVELLNAGFNVFEMMDSMLEFYKKDAEKMTEYLANHPEFEENEAFTAFMLRN